MDVEAACSDGQDNDGDGTTDCDDTDCQSPGGECKVAPDLDRTVATTLAESAVYLYQGNNPLQKDVDAMALEPGRLVMLRGRAIGLDGAPLSGVKITVKGHREFGCTYSRGDGFFDMVVKGGSRLVLNYALSGHFTVQRAVQPGWQRYLNVPAAGLVEVATRTTKVTSDNHQTQVIEGQRVEDDFGARQPLVVMEPETAATAQLPNGDERTLAA